MTNANDVLFTVKSGQGTLMDVIEFTVSERYTDSAANREKKRAGDPRTSAKGNPGLFLEIKARPQDKTAHGIAAGTVFGGVSNVVAS